ncbi:TonB-dependent receptor [Algoriphagus sp. AGSA1]|uniref:SusC/RagA family TonB-linked outer membrane protein n=1 Tax=Algoriphagus sp. AGSA1 TaxID=2907213 RepID=UPI001F3288CB|nr:TonB-dependent receptor [Algoriphagus sp. AGSA1]MCE7057345.1 TonB-dependent receptor [Algoriphagus sp. AGSA1]
MQTFTPKTGLKFLFILLIFIWWAAPSIAQQENKLRQTISLDFKNEQVEKVLQEIQKQAGITFTYDKSALKEIKIQEVNFKNAPVSQVLDYLKNETQLDFISLASTIVVQKAKDPVVESAQKQQQRTISGNVIDENGEAIPGVTVVLKGTLVGTNTATDGHFSLQVPENGGTLVFSFVGYLSQEIQISDSNTVDITLLEDTKSLDEVVVVGYGTQKKINLTGAVDQVSSEVLENRPVNNISQMLQGTMPNVNVTFSGGQPGQGGSINIRGNTSINGGSPLILIDGVAGDINRINPRDVESISVLKDAAASAIYGARAAYGVILVTTKAGQKGEMRIQYDNNFSWSTPTSRTDYITTGYDAAKLNDDAFRNATGTPYTMYTEEDYEQLLLRRNDKTEHPDRPWVVTSNRSGRDQYMYYGNWDWWNTVFTDVQSGVDHNLSVFGSSDKIEYRLSGRYNAKEGIMKVNPDQYRTFNFRSKVNAKVYDWLTISNNTQFNNTNYSYYGREGGANQNFESIRSHALPSYAPQNPDGTAFATTGLNSYAVAVFPQLLQGTMKGEQNGYELNTITNAEINLGQYWKITGSYAYNLFVGSSYFRGTKTPYSLHPGELLEVPNYQVDQLKETNTINQYQAINLYTTYNRAFGDHNIGAVVGFNQEEQKYKPISASRMDLLSLTLNDLNLGTGDMMVGGGASEWALRGLFYRLNYDYDSRYLIEFAGRYDGTSRFSKENRFGFFPSLSAGWRVSEEAFFEPIREVVNNLKFRGSYGSLGNQQVNTYAYISTLPMGNSTYLIDNALTRYIGAPAPIADDFTWEQAITSNVGLDADFLKNRLTFSLDLFQRLTKNMLTSGRSLPNVFGASEPRENAADLKTTGFELSVQWRDHIGTGKKQLTYHVQLMLSDYTAQITRFDNPTKLLSNFYEGQTLGELWGYRVDGFFKTDEEALAYEVDQSFVNRQRLRAPGESSQLRAGNIKFLDLNGDGVINNGSNTLDDHGDLEVIGNTQPRYSYGANLGANWNGIDISIFLQGIGRQHWYPGNDAADFWGPYSRPYQSFIPKFFMDEVWSEDNPDAYYPRLRGYTALNPNAELSSVNDRYLQNLAYLRVKNLQIGYSLPRNITDKLRISACRIYVSGENILTFTKLENDYIDPEMAIANISMNRVNGINNNTSGNARVYPFSKTYSMGLNVTF